MFLHAYFNYSITMILPSGPDFDGPATYQIIVRGIITQGWSGRMEGMAISRLTLDDGTILSILTGELTDQAALSGVLHMLYELHLPLISVFELPDTGAQVES